MLTNLESARAGQATQHSSGAVLKVTCLPSKGLANPSCLLGLSKPISAYFKGLANPSVRVNAPISAYFKGLANPSVRVNAPIRAESESA